LSNGETAIYWSLRRRSDSWTAAKVSHRKPVLMEADPASFEVPVAHSTMSGFTSEQIHGGAGRDAATAGWCDRAAGEARYASQHDHPRSAMSTRVLSSTLQTPRPDALPRL
jgi:hypothetical protein